VFDVAGTVLIFETEPEGESREESMAMPTDSPKSKLTFLKARQIDVLICGAISRRVREQVEAHSKNFGAMRHASAYAKITGPCGDTVEVWLDIGSNKIQKATFVSDGCGFSIQCCSTATRLSEGLRLDEIDALTQAEVLDALGSIPDDHRHCALLAVNTIKLAIKNHHAEPSKIPLRKRIRQLFGKERDHA